METQEYREQYNETLKTIIDDWEPENDLLEVTLDDPQNDFLRVIETLTRIGVASRNEKKLVQSCHILQKKGKYYIVHFKEMFLLDRRHQTNFTVEDMFRRNTIARLLEEWGLVKITDPDQMEGFVSVRKIKIIPYREKKEWELVAKYTIGKSHP
jgi:hypothetical protein